MRFVREVLGEKQSYYTKQRHGGPVGDVDLLPMFKVLFFDLPCAESISVEAGFAFTAAHDFCHRIQPMAALRLIVKESH